MFRLCVVNVNVFFFSLKSELLDIIWFLVIGFTYSRSMYFIVMSKENLVLIHSTLG